MKVSDNGLKFTAAWEKFSPTPYRATKEEGHLTIGYGHYGRDVKPGMVVTEEQALEMLKDDMAEAEGCANRYCKPGAFSQSEFDAICDCLFNVGRSWLSASYKRGKFYNGIVHGDAVSVRESVGSFIYQGGTVIKGLVRRCAGRQSLFDGNPWESAVKYGRSK